MNHHPHHLLAQGEKTVWRQKAMAFVIRSHRHLWGKNNEDPLAFLFHQGLRNDFSKDLLLGWNKFGQKRPKENWGLTSENDDKLYFPPGIVIPYILEKTLISVFIHGYDKEEKTILLEGSLASELILGDTKNPVLVIFDLFDGLFVFQEKHNELCVIIHPDSKQPFDVSVQPILADRNKIRICSKNLETDEAHAFLKNMNVSFEHYTETSDLI